MEDHLLPEELIMIMEYPGIAILGQVQVQIHRGHFQMIAAVEPTRRAPTARAAGHPLLAAAAEVLP